MTGYTHPIVEKKISFQQFILSCTRAFGACIMQRDNPMDELPDANQKVSSYHVNALAESEKELAELQATTSEDYRSVAEQARQESYRKRIACYEKARANIRLLEDMEREVERWQPPTIDHHHLKSFMLNQIRDSIKFERPGDEPELAPLDVQADYDAALAHAIRQVEHHKQELAKETERVASRNAWVRAVYDSIGVAVPEANP